MAIANDSLRNVRLKMLAVYPDKNQLLLPFDLHSLSCYYIFLEY